MKKFSIIVPVFQNAANLPVTLPAYLGYARGLEGYEVELICVDDGSSDGSLDILVDFQQRNPDVMRVVKLTRNFGQYNALMAGMAVAEGDVMAQLTADMQDPIELFTEMLKKWEDGAKIVIGERTRREDHRLRSYFSRRFNSAVNRLIDKRFPKEGFDFFILDREVADKALDINEKNSSLQVVLIWLGYEYELVPYVRRRREIGKSSWTFWRKVKRMIDVFVSNSYLPIRLVSLLGILSALGAVGYAIFRGHPVDGDRVQRRGQRLDEHGHPHHVLLRRHPLCPGDHRGVPLEDLRQHQAPPPLCDRSHPWIESRR